MSERHHITFGGIDRTRQEFLVQIEIYMRIKWNYEEKAFEINFLNLMVIQLYGSLTNVLIIV